MTNDGIFPSMIQYRNANYTFIFIKKLYKNLINLPSKFDYKLMNMNKYRLCMHLAWLKLFFNSLYKLY